MKRVRRSSAGSNVQGKLNGRSDSVDARVRRANGGFKKTKTAVAGFLLCAWCVTGVLAADPEERTVPPFECGYQAPDVALRSLRAAVKAGEIPDPLTKLIPAVRPRTRFSGRTARGTVPTVTPDDIFFFEDTARLLRTNFSDGALFNLMADAINAVLVEFGDNFDFVGFFLNFAPDHQIGGAFYLGLENNVSGLGNSIFNSRAGFGVAGDNVEGMVMMWNQSSWAPGDDFTQLVLGQEFEHRFGMFLNAIPGGRPLQGNNGSCGRGAHWNFRVDGQGSGMEIAEWVGASPATRLGGTLNINTDFGGVWSAPDLYLMGYISPAELDSLPSELRYMNNNTSCLSPYSGTISTWGSADVIATNGPRVPGSSTAQQDFRTAWVMIHLPGAVPNASQTQRVVDMLNEWSASWAFGTLGRGTMDNTAGVAFRIEFPNGTPDFLAPESPTSFAVQTINLNGAPNTGSGLLHFAIEGGPFQTAPLAFLGGNSFLATLPGFPCTATANFFVTIEATTGGTVRLPKAAPSVTASAIVGSSPVTLFADDFETDQGWSVSNDAALTDGPWDRGVPIGGGDRGDPASDFDGSGQCFLTDNVDGNSDVDGGTTTLTSPVVDVSSAQFAVLDYARWYTNDAGASPGSDFWVAEISANGVDWVTLENTNVSTGWLRKTFFVGDFVPLTSQLQVRFSASDLGAGSVVEAAVDAVRITTLSCPAGSCIPSAPAQPETIPVARNRYVAFSSPNPSRQTAIRMTFVSLPPPFDTLNGSSMWVVDPRAVSENGATEDPLPGFPSFTAATLGCAPFFTDWSALGLIHVFHEFVVPEGSYSVQIIDQACDASTEGNFSAALGLSAAQWGDTVGNCSVVPCTPPDGSIDIIDVLAITGRFVSDPNSIVKSRADIEPGTPDRIVNISDALLALNAFVGVRYPFEPGPFPCAD